MKKLILCLIALLTLTGCALFRTAGDAYRPDRPLSLTAKISTTFTAGTDAKNFGGMLRMRRDSMIVLSVAKYGIEGARVFFSPDSILILERLNKHYILLDYADFNRLFFLEKEVTFAKIQSFFWNGENNSSETSRGYWGMIFPFEVQVRRADFERIRNYNIPKHTQFRLKCFETDLRLDVKLTKVKINYDWSASFSIPKGYTPIAARELQTIIPELFVMPQ